MRYNRRKYDKTNTHDLLVQHMEEDDDNFSLVGRRLLRIELSQYIAAAALAMFLYLIQNPQIIRNLTVDAKAEAVSE